MRAKRGFAMGLDHVRNEIEHMRRQIFQQRKEIQTLQRDGISTTSAEALLQRMQDKVDKLCIERDRMVSESRLAGRKTHPGTDKIIHGPPATRRV
jgi:hypothetical protein